MQETYNKLKRYKCGCLLPSKKGSKNRCPIHKDEVDEILLKCGLCEQIFVLEPNISNYRRKYCNNCSELPKERSGVRLLIPKYAYRSYQEVGDILGISSHAVEASEKRALMKIMIRLKNSGVEFEDVINYIKYHCDEEIIEEYLKEE